MLRYVLYGGWKSVEMERMEWAGREGRVVWMMWLDEMLR